MKGRKVFAFALSVLLATTSAVLAQQPGEAKPRTVSKTATSSVVYLPAGDVKWQDLDPTGAPGAKIADLWGNHATGAFGAYLKLPAGFVAPLHTHTHDMRVVFLSGTYIQAPEGKPEVRLGPGSYMMQPGGNFKHTTKCDAAADCMFFLESDGAFDLHPVATATSPAKK